MSKIFSHISRILNRHLTIKESLIFILVTALIIYLAKPFDNKNNLKKIASAPCDTCGIGITDLVLRAKKELIQLKIPWQKK